MFATDPTLYGATLPKHDFSFTPHYMNPSALPWQASLQRFAPFAQGFGYPKLPYDTPFLAQGFGYNAPFVPQGYMPQGHVPQGFVPQGFIPQGFIPQGFIPQGFVPQGYVPQGFIPQGLVPQGLGYGNASMYGNLNRPSTGWQVPCAI